MLLLFEINYLYNSHIVVLINLFDLKVNIRKIYI